MKWNEGVAAAKWIPVLNAAEDHHEIPRNLLARQCFEESGFNPGAHNPSGAVGIMQLLPKYFPGAGDNPIRDIDSAGEYLRSLYQGFNDWQLGLAAYDWGPGNVRKWLKKGGTFATLPPETQKYVSQIVADVPVEGRICKILSLQSPQPAGSQVSQSSAATQSAPPSLSLWSRLSSRFTPKASTTIASPLPLEHSAPLSPRILSQTENQGVNEMASAVTQQTILTILEGDLLGAVAGPLETFLANVKANPLGEPGYWVQLTGALMAAAPGLELTGIQQIITALQTKLAAVVAAQAAKAAAPAA
jgi:Transglycosylase SLT domain